MREITPQDLKSHLNDYILVDVREPHEFTGPLGYIEGALLLPLGENLLTYLDSADPSKNYVFICAAGYRSGLACELAATYGINNVYNLKGGMVEWGQH